MFALACVCVRARAEQPTIFVFELDGGPACQPVVCFLRCRCVTPSVVSPVYMLQLVTHCVPPLLQQCSEVGVVSVHSPLALLLSIPPPSSSSLPPAPHALLVSSQSSSVLLAPAVATFVCTDLRNPGALFHHPTSTP